MLKPRILIFIGRYLPGYNSGGPVRTLSSIVERLGDRFEFLIVTHDRDDGDSSPYAGIQPDAWSTLGKSRVFYASTISFSLIRRIVREARPDALYLNGYWSTTSICTLVLRRFGLIGDVPVVLAPRGDLAPGAMKIRRLKKLAYRAVARGFGLYDDLLWHVSSAREQSETARAMASQYPDILSRTLIAPDLNSLSAYRRQRTAAKTSGTVRFVSLGRISPMKNYAFLLARLRDLTGDVALDIFGPMEDLRYWETCLNVIRELPANIRVAYRGVVAPGDVQQVLSGYDFFVLPTAGENFGHVIVEAASAGLPVVISDRTQWLRLEGQGVGWDLSLEAPDEWTRKLQSCIDMEEAAYAPLSAAAARWGAAHLDDPQSLAQNAELFLRAAQRGISRPASMAQKARLS